MEQLVTVGEAKLWTNISESKDRAKPYLLMIGGGPGVSDGLATLEPLLGGHYNVIRFDARGCGRSTADGQYDVETTLGDIEAIRQHYEVEQWYVLGHSWGADLALFCAMEHPGHCLKVLHLCGLGMQNDIDWAAECAGNNWPEEEPANEYPMNYDVLDTALQSYWKYLQRPTLWRHLADLQVPVLVACAENDPRPHWPNRQLAHLLPVADFRLLAECAHWPWLRHPDLLRDMLFDWFTEESYIGRLDTWTQFIDHDSTSVRWLCPDADFGLIQSYFWHFNVFTDDDTYFGISLRHLRDEYSGTGPCKGRLCGYILDGTIVSLAGVEYALPECWEISAVSTLPTQTGKGYSTAVCAFLARNILGNGKQAFCETNRCNFAMQRVLQKIGIHA